MRASLPVVACLIALAATAGAQNLCRFYLANHSDAAQGLTLSLEAPPNAAGVCPLSAVSINLSVGDGTGFHHVSVAQPWQTGVVQNAGMPWLVGTPMRKSLSGGTA